MLDGAKQLLSLGLNLITLMSLTIHKQQALALAYAVSETAQKTLGHKAQIGPGKEMLLSLSRYTVISVIQR